MPPPLLIPTAASKTAPHDGGNCRKMCAVAPVAQMDRVAASEAAGRWFESNRARHFKTKTYAHAGPRRYHGLTIPRTQRRGKRITALPAP